MGKQAVVVARGDAPTLNVIGDLITPLITAADTASGLEIFDLSGPRDSGPPPHDHPWDEAYVMIDGEVEVHFGERRATIRSGDAVNIPAGTVHAYRIVSQAARFIVVTSTEGAAKFFADMDAEVHQMPEDAPG